MITYWCFMVAFVFLTGYFAYNNYKLNSKLSEKQFLDKEELLIYEYERKSKEHQVDQITKELIKVEKEKQDIDNSIEEHKCELKTIYEAIKERQSILDSIKEQIASINYELEKELSDKKRKIDGEFQNHVGALKEAMETIITSFRKKENEIAERIRTMEQHTVAHIEAQKREAEMKDDTEFYRLSLTSLEVSDVTKLLDLANTFSQPDILKKLVYKTYFEKKMNDLLGRVVGDNSEISGVYKITHIDSGKAYIGQATNIKERWRKHIKCGLGIDTPSTNSFYQGMMSLRPWNFTWEILEACPKDKLNEVEKYYIDHYQTKSWGWNSKGGNTK